MSIHRPIKCHGARLGRRRSSISGALQRNSSASLPRMVSAQRFSACWVEVGQNFEVSFGVFTSLADRIAPP